MKRSHAVLIALGPVVAACVVACSPGDEVGGSGGPAADPAVTDDAGTQPTGGTGGSGAGTAGGGTDPTGPDASAGGGGELHETECADHADNDGDNLTDCDDIDCVVAPECAGTCPVIPEPAEVAEAPLPGESPAGATQSATAGSFHDDYVLNSAGSLKVGARREWGGSIVFFGMHNGSAGMNNTNAIDANDTGREVQVAFYDPDRHMQNCAWNGSCQSTPSTCPMSITYLGWNPVQGGNRCNRGSGVEGTELAAGTMTATTRPLFWNPNWDRQDCSDQCCSDPTLATRQSDVRVVQRVRFVTEHVVELDYELVNLVATSHAATAQEFPTVYTANGDNGTPDLWRMWSSSGSEIVIDTPGNDGFYYENFTSPEGWVTMQNGSLDYGVGLYTETRVSQWQAWQLRSLPFNNFRPLVAFGIPSLGTIRARSYLILGALGTISAEAAWLDSHLAPFGKLDAPVADANLSGVVNLHGWALDNKGVTSVELVVDGGPPTSLTYGTARPDVCLVWPGYAACDAVGYAGSIDASALSQCAHLLEIRATDTDGNQRVIARRRVTVTP